MTFITLCTIILVLLLNWMKIWSMWLTCVYFLNGTNLKRPKTPLSNQLKTNFFNLSLQINIPGTLNFQIKIVLNTTTIPPLQQVAWKFCKWHDLCHLDNVWNLASLLAICWLILKFLLYRIGVAEIYRLFQRIKEY